MAQLPPHPSREIQVFNHERSDGSTTLFWHAGRLAAVGTVVRDVANLSVASVWENPEVFARPAHPEPVEVQLHGHAGLAGPGGLPHPAT